MRFVILRHQPGPSAARPLHWDLMLETEHGLRTWALESEPALGRRIGGESLNDHRKAYLEYEGPLSNDRGLVERWDRGEFGWLSKTAEELVVQLNGGRLECRVHLENDPDEPRRWVVHFKADERVG